MSFKRLNTDLAARSKADSLGKDVRSISLVFRLSWPGSADIQFKYTEFINSSGLAEKKGDKHTNTCTSGGIRWLVGWGLP